MSQGIEQETKAAPGAITVKVTPDDEHILRALDLGQRLALARQRRGLTQKQLSALVGKSRATIVQYEQGRLQPPVQQIETMARALGVPPELIAFGRLGLTGLSHDNAQVTSLPEIDVESEGESVSGGHGLASSLVQHLGVEPDHARVYVLGHAAPAFGFRAGDRVIVNVNVSLHEPDRLYAFRSTSGVTLARLVPQLAAGSQQVSLMGSHGETLSHDRRDLGVLGLVVGSIQAR